MIDLTKLSINCQLLPPGGSLSRILPELSSTNARSTTQAAANQSINQSSIKQFYWRKGTSTTDIVIKINTNKAEISTHTIIKYHLCIVQKSMKLNFAKRRLKVDTLRPRWHELVLWSLLPADHLIGCYKIQRRACAERKSKNQSTQGRISDLLAVGRLKLQNH